MTSQDFGFDSGEYEFLTEAVAMSANITGMCAEIGVRLGRGTATIIEAMETYRPHDTMLSIDPFGSILYKPREHMEPCRLDYTDEMGKTCMAQLSQFVLNKSVDWQPKKMTDIFFFKRYSEGVEAYNIDTFLINKYAMVHLDGPHSLEHISLEFDWFYDRMDTGATVVLDDVTPDFICIEDVDTYIKSRFERVKTGVKKAIYVKK